MIAGLAADLKPAQAAELLLRRRAARRSLLEFTKLTHPNFVEGEHHRVICDALEAVERGDINRLVIEAPPRHTKSELTSIRFPAWYMGRNPSKQIISLSYGDDLATDFGGQVRNLMRDDVYQSLFGVELAADTAAKGRWRTDQGGVYTATGIFGTVTGRGAHLAIIDDPFKNREDSDSARIREKVWREYSATIRTRLMPGGAVVVMATRWHEDDLIGRLIKRQSGWERVSLPAITGEGTANEKALWPGWYPLTELHKIKSDLMPRDWYALYQQQPRVEDGDYIRREWFDLRFEEAPSNLRIYMASDFAVTEPRQGADPDFTEHGVFGVDPSGDIYVLDWWFGQTSSEAWVEVRLDLIEKYKPSAVFGEGGVIRRAVEPIIIRRKRERKIASRDEWLNPVRDKATRGRSFQAMASMRRVYFSKSPWADRVIDQCVAFPGGAHDDAFDVMSLFCQAIDQAHPAIVREPKPKASSDYAAPTSGGKSWRTV